MNNRDLLARQLHGALPARDAGGKDGAVIDARTIKRAVAALGGVSDMAVPKRKVATKKAAPKKNPLAAAKARVAKLEATAKRKTAISTAQAGVKKAQLALKSARKIGKSPFAKKKG